jgi:L-rhamnose mutarotase
MEQVVFKMKLKPGFKAEYITRHDKIWPELVALLKESGIKKYDIFFDEQTDSLIAVQYIDDGGATNLAGNPIMIKWWEYMADLMETNPDKSPVVVGLENVFSMP